MQTQHYVLGCYRYIEMNPVRANMMKSGKMNGQMNAMNGDRPEWHLLNFFRVTMYANVCASMRTCIGEQRIGFRSSLDGPWFDAAGAIADPLLGNQHE